MMGITPRLSLGKFNKASECWVQVTIVPKIFYRAEDFAYACDSQIPLEHHQNENPLQH